MASRATTVGVLHVVAGLLCAGAGASLHCAVRREISPCSCRPEDAATGAILVTCQRMTSFHQIVETLKDKFSPETKISLEISHSELPDLATRSFKELAISITKLKLNHDNLSQLNNTVFTKLDLVDFFSLSDNQLSSLPRHVLRHLPHIHTLDLRRNNIDRVSELDFQHVQDVNTILIADNQIAKLERHSLPKSLKHIHLGINKLHSLNGALRDLDYLEWIFINANHLTSLANELPVVRNWLKDSGKNGVDGSVGVVQHIFVPRLKLARRHPSFAGHAACMPATRYHARERGTGRSSRTAPQR